MSLRDLCDVVYVLLVERIERRANALTASLAAWNEKASAIADEMRRAFDEALTAAPKPESEIDAMMRGWGVA